MYPLVSVLTPTYNRRKFWPQAIQCMRTQDYPNIEWVVYDDGDDRVEDLMPVSEIPIRYVYYPTKKNHGEKMNFCVKHALSDYLIVWDDDDWYCPDRISRQIQPLMEGKQLTGTSSHYCYNGNPYKYTSPVNWLASIAFTRSEWEKHGGFDEIPAGADWNFQKKVAEKDKVDLADASLVTCAIHGDNAGSRNINGSYITVSWGELAETGLPLSEEGQSLLLSETPQHQNVRVIPRRLQPRLARLPKRLSAGR